jgi:deoxyribonuclease-4
VVSHPGNYIDHREAGLERNARNYTECLHAVPEVRLLIEGTAGSGTALGSTFEELAELRERIAPDVRDRVGFCLDTCHLYSAGYDLVRASMRYGSGGTGWWGSSTCAACISTTRRLHSGPGETGTSSWRRGPRPDPVSTDHARSAFAGIPKILETPKGDDLVTNDRRMLRRLRAYARPPRRPG